MELIDKVPESERNILKKAAEMILEICQEKKLTAIDNRTYKADKASSIVSNGTQFKHNESLIQTFWSNKKFDHEYHSPVGKNDEKQYASGKTENKITAVTTKEEQIINTDNRKNYANQLYSDNIFKNNLNIAYSISDNSINNKQK